MRHGSLFEGIVRVGELTHDERAALGLIRQGRRGSLIVHDVSHILDPDQIEELEAFRQKSGNDSDVDGSPDTQQTSADMIGDKFPLADHPSAEALREIVHASLVSENANPLADDYSDEASMFTRSDRSFIEAVLADAGIALTAEEEAVLVEFADDYASMVNAEEDAEEDAALWQAELQDAEDKARRLHEHEKIADAVISDMLPEINRKVIPVVRRAIYAALILHDEQEVAISGGEETMK